jgi:hypothetical protein
VTPTEAPVDCESDGLVAFEIWKCHRANNSWVRAGRYRTRAEAVRAVPNFGHAPGWAVLPVWQRPTAADAGA